MRHHHHSLDYIPRLCLGDFHIFIPHEDGRGYMVPSLGRRPCKLLFPLLLVLCGSFEFCEVSLTNHANLATLIRLKNARATTLFLFLCKSLP